MSEPLRPIEWTGSGIRVIDQTQLPGRLAYLALGRVDDLVDAIVRLAVRGAPQLGAIGALGVVVAMDEGVRERWTAGRLDGEIDRIRDARPTAVNLAWGVDRVRPLVARGRDAVLEAALEIVAEDERVNRAIGRNGADWIQARVPGRVRVLTHCNTGALATTAWGTALGIVRELHARGVLEVVYVDETRPLLQGSRLTAWELARDGIPHLVQADGAAAGTILGGLVDVAIVGADRIAANGDTANKIGSVGVALACADAGIPFVVAAPESTVDLATASGAGIEIEQRPEAEVLAFAGVPTAPPGSRAHNPAFDVTPARLIAALVTEAGVLEVREGRVPGARDGDPGRRLIEELAEVGRDAVGRGLVVASGGNLSARLPGGDTFVVTAAGTWLDRLVPGDFTVMALDGSVVGGNPHPSTEWRLHRQTYRTRPDVNAVVHLHPQTAVVLDALGHAVRLLTLDHVTYLGRVARVPFFPNGSDELADAAAEASRDCDAIILANHGCSALGDTVAMAWRRAVNLEEAAANTFRCLQLGDTGTTFPEEATPVHHG